MSNPPTQQRYKLFDKVITQKNENINDLSEFNKISTKTPYFFIESLIFLLNFLKNGITNEVLLK